MSKRLLNLCLTALLSVVATGAWALSKVDGVYQIGTAEDLKAFAELVNGGEVKAQAVLTADIDKGMDLTMIGSAACPYDGTFDGAGHTITIDAYPTTNGCAIFRNTDYNSLIQNLKVKGTITTDKQNAAGIVAWSYGTIRGCWADVTIKSAVAGDGTHGGITCNTYNGSIIEDCLAQITIDGPGTTNCGGVAGWASGRTNIVNCLVINNGTFKVDNNSGTLSRNDPYLHNIEDMDKYREDNYETRAPGCNINNYALRAWGSTKFVELTNADDLASGKICYQLNNDQTNITWKQEIGVDAFPVPAAFGTKQVYASGATNCDGRSEEDLTYSNEGTANATAHTYDKFGICTECARFNFGALKRDAADGFYLIGTADDIDMMEGLNRISDGGRFAMKMTDDISYTAEPTRSIFNVGNWFYGTFDGQGHALTIEMTEVPTRASIFPYFCGTFKNAIVHGSIGTPGQYAGSLISRTLSDGTTIENVFSDVTINASRTGDNTHGGLIGDVGSKTFITNCIYAGDINCEDGVESVGGFAGWSGGVSYYTNCAFLGTINNASGDSYVLSRNPSQVKTENVYWIDDFGVLINNEEGNERIEDPAIIESGELAFLLNSNKSGLDRFYQKIGTDLIPMPLKKDGATIYAVASSYRCDGKPQGTVTYTNTDPGQIVLPPHTYDEGFCTECGGLQEDYLTPVDGWFEISNGAELLWWSHYASTHLGANARLTDDIDMADYCDRYAIVGTEGMPFYGNFDGQYHVISNFVLDRPGVNGVGLIGVMNSLPTSGRTADGQAIDATAARKAEGSFIKNVTLDNTCSITGNGYVALVGMTAAWAGHVKISGVMMEGDVSAINGANAAGVFGCVMGSACAVTIDNCGMTGNVYGPKENASFSGWLGSYAVVSNCFAVGEVQGIQSEERYFARFGTATFSNCFARYGKQPDVGIVSADDFLSGALAWKANGSQFRNCLWYQTINEDPYPYADPSHGTVIYTAEQYFSVADDEDLSAPISATQEYITNSLEDVIATASLLEEYQEMNEALADVTSIADLADALDALAKKDKEVRANETVYKTYIAKVAEATAYMTENADMQGDVSQALRYYLEQNDEPSEENALGTALYIIEEHTATAAEIEAETKRLAEWLATAISVDYVKGTDVTNLFANADFGKGTGEGWTESFATGTGKLITEDAAAAKLIGVESWNKTGDMYQTVEGLKPGYYLVGVHGAYRPNNNRYSYNYAAGIYANDNFNFFPTVQEDIVEVGDTIDQVNCNLHGNGAHDLAIYDDPNITNDEQAEEAGATLLGYAVQGPSGMAAAMNAGRYKVYTMAEVGEDGKLTIGVTNPGTTLQYDWTGWAGLKVTYLGTEPDADAVATVVANMQARANTILEMYEIDENEAAKAPNYPAALREELDALNAASEGDTENYENVVKFSQMFRNIYAGKRAYINLMAKAGDLMAVENANLPYVEKDEESGEWVETGEYVFSDDLLEQFYEVGSTLQDEYFEGTLSTEEALNPEVPEAFVEVIAPQDEDGNYLISSAKQLLFFRAVSSFRDYRVSAKLQNDISLSGIGMQPINQWNYSYRGTFDGQGYAISDIYLNYTDDSNGRCALFNTIDNATIKNLKVTGDYYSGGKYMAGIAGAVYNSKVQNCEIHVTLNSTIEGDGTHGGVIGPNYSDGTVIENCLVDVVFNGENTHSCGGVIGWSNNLDTVRNCLILSTYNINTATGCHNISRNDGNCTMSNNYYVNVLGTAAGTKVDAELLASGEVAYKLNGSSSEEPVWFQTLGQDATPVLFNGSVVYYYGDEYINDKPNPQLNAYAYNVRRTSNGVKYTLNAEAASVKAVLADGTKVDIATDQAAGTHMAQIAGEVKGIEVTGKGSKDILKMGESIAFSSPYGLAINNNPASKNFGQVLIPESRPVEDVSEYVSAEKPGALFALTPDLEIIDAYYGGLTFESPLAVSGDNDQYGLRDIRFTKDGRLFVANASGRTNSSVYEIDPENLEQAWTPVFKGGELDEATGITYVGDEEQNRMAISIAFEGEGEDLKMYVLGGQRSNGEVNTTDYNCSIYNLGTAKEWTGAPSANYANLDGVYTITPRHIGIHEDGKGGLWYLQYNASPSEDEPTIKHWDAEGKENYSNITKNPYGGKMAMTADGNYMAMANGKNSVVVFECSYVPMANGNIFLENKYTVSTAESAASGLAFDYANNLYVASSGTHTLSRYTVPSLYNNVITTPVVLDAEGVTGDVNGDGVVTIQDVVAVLEMMAADNNDATGDVNGDGAVTIQDVVAVLEIMAAQ